MSKNPESNIFDQVPTSDILSIYKKSGTDAQLITDLLTHASPEERTEVIGALAALASLNQESVIEPD